MSTDIRVAVPDDIPGVLALWRASAAPLHRYGRRPDRPPGPRPRGPRGGRVVRAGRRHGDRRLGRVAGFHLPARGGPRRRRSGLGGRLLREAEHRLPRSGPGGCTPSWSGPTPGGGLLGVDGLGAPEWAAPLRPRVALPVRRATTGRGRASAAGCRARRSRRSRPAATTRNRRRCPRRGPGTTMRVARTAAAGGSGRRARAYGAGSCRKADRRILLSNRSTTCVLRNAPFTGARSGGRSTSPTSGSLTPDRRSARPRSSRRARATAPWPGRTARHRARPVPLQSRTLRQMPWTRWSLCSTGTCRPVARACASVTSRTRRTADEDGEGEGGQGTGSQWSFAANREARVVRSERDDHTRDRHQARRTSGTTVRAWAHPGPDAGTVRGVVGNVKGGVAHRVQHLGIVRPVPQQAGMSNARTAARRVRWKASPSSEHGGPGTRQVAQ